MEAHCEEGRWAEPGWTAAGVRVARCTDVCSGGVLLTCTHATHSCPAQQVWFASCAGHKPLTCSSLGLRISKDAVALSAVLLQAAGAGTAWGQYGCLPSI